MARTPATPATRRLSELGIDFVGHPYLHDPRVRNFGMEAAEALGVEPRRVFKTLVVSVEGVGLAVGVIPVAAMLDVRALAQCVGGKHADLADVAVAERATGYVHGGISPIGQRRSLPTVIDLSAQEHRTILVSGGRRGFDIELTPHDLATSTGARFAAIIRLVD